MTTSKPSIQSEKGIYQSTPDRNFNWTSSADGDLDTLAELDRRMNEFYSLPQLRSEYQAMLDLIDEGTDSPTAIADCALDQVCLGTDATSQVLEVGCGSGRLYRQLQGKEYLGHYTGVEMAQYVTDGNRARFPEASWRVGNIYRIEDGDEAFDVVLTFYVLEHTVFPERAFAELLRIVKVGGRLVLVFPDFVATGRLPSQMTGFSVGTTTEKLKRGHLLDAVVSLYDNRIRLPRALQTASTTIGSFPVNLKPLCLSNGIQITADVDATYIASKEEVRAWFEQRGHIVEFPAGKEGLFQLHSLLVITKGPKATVVEETTQSEIKQNR